MNTNFLVSRVPDEQTKNFFEHGETIMSGDTKNKVDTKNHDPFEDRFHTTAEFEAKLKELRAEYDAKLEYIDERRKKIVKAEKAAVKIEDEARELLGDFLQSLFFEYLTEEKKLLPKYDWPEGVLEKQQQLLDEGSIVLDNPLRESRFKTKRKGNADLVERRKPGEK